MQFMVRYLQAATALLYFGPLVAGMAGLGWIMLPPFASIFVLWLVILRPQQWPQSAADWLSGSTLIAALGQIVSQVFLVAVCFGIGRGIGGVLGYLPAVHPFFPIALSFAALPFARLFWDPERALVEDLSVDDLMYPQQPTLAPRRKQSTADALSSLLALPDRAPIREVALRLEDVLEDADTAARISALSDALVSAPPERNRALREALILWATEPVDFASGRAPGALRAAFAAAGQDALLLRVLLPRATALAKVMPQKLDQFPEPAVIDDIAHRCISADVRAGLVSLADFMRNGVSDQARPTAFRPRFLQQSA